VFKVVLAAAAYECGLDWYTHHCTGAGAVLVILGDGYGKGTQ